MNWYEDIIYRLTKLPSDYAAITADYATLSAEMDSYKRKNDNTDRDYWDNKWEKNKVVYKAQKYDMDIRNLVITKSNIMNSSPIYKEGVSQDVIALDTLKAVVARLRYDSDSNIYGTPEYWEYPEITFQRKTGDCEDGALLLISLMRMAGIPAYRVKLCAGWVKMPGTEQLSGHAYVIYLADDACWYAMDWCYYAEDSIANFKKVMHSDNPMYKGIWWTANDQYTWAQKNTVVKPK